MDRVDNYKYVSNTIGAFSGNEVIQINNTSFFVNYHSNIVHPPYILLNKKLYCLSIEYYPVSIPDLKECIYWEYNLSKYLNY